MAPRAIDPSFVDAHGYPIILTQASHVLKGAVKESTKVAGVGIPRLVSCQGPSSGYQGRRMREEKKKRSFLS